MTGERERESQRVASIVDLKSYAALCDPYRKPYRWTNFLRGSWRRNVVIVVVVVVVPFVGSSVVFPRE